VLTLSDIRSRVRTRYEASSTTRWSDADVNDAINDGLEELSEATRYFERWVSVPLQGGRCYYDLRGLTPETVLSVTSVYHDNGNRWLAPISICDMGYAEWEQTTGSPINWFTRGLWWLGLWPHTSTDPGEFVRVYYTAVAPRMEDDGEEPRQLSEEFIPALEEYAIYELHQREGETDKALYWWGQYKTRERDLEQHMAHRVTQARTGKIGRA